MNAAGPGNAEHGQGGRRCGWMILDRSTRMAVLIILLAGPLPSAAQNAPVPNVPVPQTRDQNACSDGQRAPSDQSLSKRLEQTDGVICPPEVDPDIKAPTPQGGRMPIIPPPGSPGGDPTVRPK
jgi:hypothetical protein